MTAVLTPYAMRLASCIGAVDLGGYRRLYRGEIPLLGGLAIAIPFVGACVFSSFEPTLMFLAIKGDPPSIFLPLAAGCATILLLGIADDIYHLSARTKLAVQVLVALFLCWHGAAMTRIALPVIGVIELGRFSGTVITVLWLVGLINAFNMLDGIDGLATSVALVAALGFTALAAVMGHTLVVLLSLTLAGSLIAFLFYNFPPAKLFLGDTGSMFLGFCLASIGLLGGHKSQATVLLVSPMLILGLPILETLLSMTRRFVRGRPVFFGDDHHTHHRLSHMGYSPRQVVLLLCGVGALLSMAGVLQQTVPAQSGWAVLPYMLYGTTALGTAWFAGYVPSPGKLMASLARRRQNSLLTGLTRYAVEALNANNGQENLDDVLHLFQKHAGLRFIEVWFEDGAAPLSTCGFADESASGATQPIKTVRINRPGRRGLIVRFQFDHVPSQPEGTDITSALARTFQKARIRSRGADSTDEKARILGIGVNLLDYRKVMDTINAWRASRPAKSRYVIAINPHSAMMCKRNKNVRRAMANAALSLPDGIGMVWAANILGHSHFGRVTGPTLMFNLCDGGRAYGFRHFFYGGAKGVADELARHLAAEFPGLQVAGTYCPPFSSLSEEEDKAIVETINNTKADILWVGLGAPKQEEWMAAHVDSIQVPVMIGVGAAFDFHSGNVKWAPKWIRAIGMEWAYRLALEPKRMWRRNLDSPLFLLNVLAQRLKPPALRDREAEPRREFAKRNEPSQPWEQNARREPVGEIRNTLVYGTGRHSSLFLHEVNQEAAAGNKCRRIVGLIADGQPSGRRYVHDHRAMGSIETLDDLLDSNSIHEVVIAEELSEGARRRIVEVCIERQVHVSEWKTGLNHLVKSTKVGGRDVITYRGVPVGTSGRTGNSPGETAGELVGVADAR